MNEMAPAATNSLTARIQEALRLKIVGGTFSPGMRLPSSEQLARDFGVSRTVIREAIAALRSDRLVDSRRGAGVFVIEPPPAPAGATGLVPFQNLNLARISSLIEMLELRTALEGDAAALAAERRSPAHEARILEVFGEFEDGARRGLATADVDFRFHMAVAEASNNPRFGEFLSLFGPSIIPRRGLTDGSEVALPRGDLDRLILEHQAIVTAILDGDAESARKSMRSHLMNSQARYRALLRGTSAAPERAI